MPTSIARHRSAVLAALAFNLTLCAQVEAQAPFMVADIATAQVPTYSYPAYPLAIAELNGIYYFTAEDGIHGRELFRSDGTADGTWLVRDICPGFCSSVGPAVMAAMDGRLYFSADDGEHGFELWTSDGTAQGTQMVSAT